MKTKKRGQVSVEYMIVLGFATFAITGIIGLAFYYVNSTDDQMRSNHIQNFAKSIIDNAESVYYAGSPSKITITPYLPKGVSDISFKLDPGNSEYYLFITYSTSSGNNVISFKSNVPLLETSVSNPAISPSEGIKNIVIEFSGTSIKISEAS
jgi:uncharacterized protein (UPF0333 family)